VLPCSCPICPVNVLSPPFSTGKMPSSFSLGTTPASVDLSLRRIVVCFSMSSPAALRRGLPHRRSIGRRPDRSSQLILARFKAPSSSKKSSPQDSFECALFLTLSTLPHTIRAKRSAYSTPVCDLCSGDYDYLHADFSTSLSVTSLVALVPACFQSISPHVRRIQGRPKRDDRPFPLACDHPGVPPLPPFSSRVSLRPSQFCEARLLRRFLLLGFRLEPRSPLSPRIFPEVSFVSFIVRHPFPLFNFKTGRFRIPRTKSNTRCLVRHYEMRKNGSSPSDL